MIIQATLKAYIINKIISVNFFLFYLTNILLLHKKIFTDIYFHNCLVLCIFQDQRQKKKLQGINSEGVNFGHFRNTLSSNQKPMCGQRN